ncbi:MAG: hypothetical protein JSW50_11910, partial [Candidatus Latescibacterota bacterium]
IVDLETGPQELCFRCGIYFRDSCLLREVVKRTCYYYLHRPNHNGEPSESLPAPDDQTHGPDRTNNTSG